MKREEFHWPTCYRVFDVWLVPANRLLGTRKIDDFLFFDSVRDVFEGQAPGGVMTIPKILMIRGGLREVEFGERTLVEDVYCEGHSGPLLRLVRRPGQGDVDLVPHSKGGGVVSGWELKESAEHANG